ncbi:MAG: aminomethyl-transferring glycine dehydrogenase subunit GcvPA [Peptococcaceae bacterium]|nr:aminomethyl-transferring glycine dehydrogenase subunit GcvPA [Peptococcaceae bacterium]
MRYVINTGEDRREMLARIGAGSVEDLFRDIPAEVRLKQPLNLPHPMAEPELARHLREMSAANRNLDEYACFLGAGAYDHYVPQIVDQLLLRSEFYTAYTPYQPEISQGTLQAVFEYQSLICALTGMEAANASLYDGASALAEAALMACGETKRDRVVLSETVHPEYRETVRTYLRYRGVEVTECPETGGVTDPERLMGMVDGRTAAVLIQQPNFFGCLEQAPEIGEAARRHGALFVVCADPVSLGVLEAPGEYGADIVVGEGQGLGNQLSFGGPCLGFMACRQKLVRRMPGRLVGQTADKHGRRGFVLTIQAREQHIRREKATSNICSNEALCALAAAIYLSCLGKEGLRRVADLCLQKAHYAHGLITSLEGVSSSFKAPFFKEFAVRLEEDPAGVNRRLLKDKIIGGLDLGRFYPRYSGHMLLCCTELRTREEIERLAAGIGGKPS